MRAPVLLGFVGVECLKEGIRSLVADIGRRSRCVETTAAQGASSRAAPRAGALPCCVSAAPPCPFRPAPPFPAPPLSPPNPSLLVLHAASSLVLAEKRAPCLRRRTPWWQARTCTHT
jgi:hypothetical protein